MAEEVVYLIGSLKNENIPPLARRLHDDTGYEIFDEWISCGPEADRYWQEYEQARGHSFERALSGWHAKHVFAFDKYHLDRCTIGILVLPAGKSGHLELGYLAGRGKRTYILTDGEPESFDQMYQFADGVFSSIEALVEALK